MSLGATLGCVDCDRMCDLTLDRGQTERDRFEVLADWLNAPAASLLPPEHEEAYRNFLTVHEDHHFVVVCDEDGGYRSSGGTSYISVGGKR